MTGHMPECRRSFRHGRHRVNKNRKRRNKKTHMKQEQAKHAFHYRSEDGLVEVITKTATAKRFPAHDYPVVCLRFKPQAGTRVQKHGDGVEVVMTHQEVARHLAALNRADSKGNYRWNNVAPKCPHRKAHWDQVNRERNSKQS